ncbi:hypothetical protein SASPL_110461 [Salvia splendens]|uniref:Uncharacterized protein n=1 Tax=Salvia splendens TaxID=180675 RepID=A0A8X8YAP3_SALSN|nr:uncharacterized protein LOC121798066 [Salvia splendens]KAG6426241.1 hypothetical protein SASPL_110461 [Salvia splendens]
MSPDRPNLWRILSDTSALISAHSLHFTALSILFLFPSSFAAVVYSLLSLPNNPLQTLHLRLQSTFSAADYQIPAVGASHLLVSLISLIFTICATASISSSTFNAFYGKPVELATALKSAIVKFLPLLATTLAVQIVIALIVSVFLGFVAITSNGIADLYNQYYLAIVIAVAVLMVALMFYLQIEWSLSNAVVVLESDWGFAALKRSSYLVKGARGVMFSFLLFFLILAGVFVICFFKYVMIEYGSGADAWNCWLVLKIAAFAVFSSLLSLYSVAALTVFFIYCKASRHELHFEIDAPNGKLADDYVTLPYHVIV